MSRVQSTQAPLGLDYDALEAAVLESSRGRWFLEEFARRHRGADTRMLLDAIQKLENALISRSTAMAQAGAEHAEFASLLQTIRRTRSEMASVRNHFLTDGGAVDDDSTLYEKLAEAAKSAADHLMTRTEALRHTSASIKENEAGSPYAAQIDTQLAGLQSLAWSQDVLSQRIAKAMGLLAHIDERVSIMAGEVAPSALRPNQRSKAELTYFKQDEEIFQPVEVKPAIMVVEASPPPAAPAPAPHVQPHEPPKHARLIVKRYTPESSAIPGPAPATVEEQPIPAPPIAAEPSPPPAEEPQTPARKRVVIVRRKSSEALEIPLANEVPASAVG